MSTPDPDDLGPRIYEICDKLVEGKGIWGSGHRAQMTVFLSCGRTAILTIELEDKDQA